MDSRNNIACYELKLITRDVIGLRDDYKYRIGLQESVENILDEQAC